MTGTILAVPAIGLTAIYAVLRFPNFAVASHATAGAYAGWVANVEFGLPIVPSLLVATLVAGLIGLITDEILLKPFRAAGFVTTAIGSLALTIALGSVWEGSVDVWASMVDPVALQSMVMTALAGYLAMLAFPNPVTQAAAVSFG